MSHRCCPCLCAEPVQLSVVAVQQRSRKTLPWTTVLLCCSKLWAGTGVWWGTTVEMREVTTTLNPHFSLSLSVCLFVQGFLSFGIFGLDRHLIILPFKKRCKHSLIGRLVCHVSLVWSNNSVCVRLLGLWQGRDIEDLSPSSVPEEVRLTCTQFVRYHKDQCVQDVVHTRRY